MIELTSAQRAFLRSQAQTIEPVVMVGKDGMGDNVGRALDEALSCHELVKVRFQAHKDEVKDIARELESFTGSTLVSTHHRLHGGVLSSERQAGEDALQPQDAHCQGHLIFCLFRYRRGRVYKYGISSRIDS